MRIVPALVLFAACSQSSEITHAPYIDDGSPEAIGVLALLAADVSDRSFLDDVVGLESRAVSHLLAAQNGEDRIRGTVDDQPFTAIADVEGTRFVGYHALDTLVDWAFALGFVPGSTPEDIVVDGIVFDGLEASTTLGFVNDAPPDLLVTAGLDRRAVAGVVEARPFPHLWAVGDAWFVGPTALETLRTTAMMQDVAITDLRFANDLRQAIVELYEERGEALEARGAVPVAVALAGVHVRRVSMLDGEDPYGHLPADAALYTHPDPVFPDNKRMWHGAYAWETGVSLSLYWYE